MPRSVQLNNSYNHGRQIKIRIFKPENKCVCKKKKCLYNPGKQSLMYKFKSKHNNQNKNLMLIFFGFC